MKDSKLGRKAAAVLTGAALIVGVAAGMAHAGTVDDYVPGRLLNNGVDWSGEANLTKFPRSHWIYSSADVHMTNLRPQAAAVRCTMTTKYFPTWKRTEVHQRTRTFHLAPFGHAGYARTGYLNVENIHVHPWDERSGMVRWMTSHKLVCQAA